MSFPRITVIMPSYNQGKYLERAICSVLDQDYPELEFFVIDGGSWDECPRIIEHYAGELSWSEVAEDRNAADAINKGIRRATGDIITVLHADDLLMPGALHDAAAFLSAGTGVRWAVGHAQRIDEDDDVIGIMPARQPISPEAFITHRSGCLPSSSTYWRRELFHSYGLLDASLSFAYNFEFASRLLMAGLRPRIIPATLASRREHDGSRSTLYAVAQGMETVSVGRQYAMSPVTATSPVRKKAA